MTNDALYYFPYEIYIEQSNEIEGYYDNKEARLSSYEAWNFLSVQEEITHEVICKTQGMIASWQTDLPTKYKGAYRDCNVWIAGRQGPPPTTVHNLMEDWINGLKNNDPLTNHIKFEQVHPAADGNGRTGRMLYWYQCLEQAVTPILFTSESRLRYYELFQ